MSKGSSSLRGAPLASVFRWRIVVIVYVEIVHEQEERSGAEVFEEFECEIRRAVGAPAVGGELGLERDQGLVIDRVIASEVVEVDLETLIEAAVGGEDRGPDDGAGLPPRIAEAFRNIIAPRHHDVRAQRADERFILLGRICDHHQSFGFGELNHVAAVRARRPRDRERLARG